jgi:hypothetical protein
MSDLSGKAVDIAPGDLDGWLSTYVSKIKNDKALFDLGPYFFVKASDAVRGSALAALVFLLTPILALLKGGGRFRNTQVNDALIRLFENPKYAARSMNRSKHSYTDFCMFLTKKLVALVKHVRRLATPNNRLTKYVECTRRITPKEKDIIDGMIKVINRQHDRPASSKVAGRGLGFQ